jgi:hypothetical protein
VRDKVAHRINLKSAQTRELEERAEESCHPDGSWPASTACPAAQASGPDDSAPYAHWMQVAYSRSSNEFMPPPPKDATHRKAGCDAVLPSRSSSPVTERYRSVSRPLVFRRADRRIGTSQEPICCGAISAQIIQPWVSVSLVQYSRVSVIS